MLSQITSNVHVLSMAVVAIAAAGSLPAYAAPVNDAYAYNQAPSSLPPSSLPPSSLPQAYQAPSSLPPSSLPPSSLPPAYAYAPAPAPAPVPPPAPAPCQIPPTQVCASEAAAQCPAGTALVAITPDNWQSIRAQLAANNRYDTFWVGSLYGAKRDGDLPYAIRADAQSTTLVSVAVPAGTDPTYNSLCM